MVTRDTLYKLDSTGNVREWRMEIEGNFYRTVSGVQGGKHVTSEWKEAFAKNIGKANATTDEEQAIAEVDAIYTKRLDRDYHADVKTLKTPKYFKPMLADKWEDRKDRIEYPVAVQPKLDGVRAIVKQDGIWTRQGKRLNAMPHIENELAPLFEKYPHMILDGELYNHELRDDFNKIISLVRKSKPTEDDLAASRETVQFHVYDTGHNQDLPYFERGMGLAHFIELNEPKYVVLTHTDFAESEEEVDNLFGAYIEQGFEGGIIRLNTPYEQKRSKGLLKRKDFEDAEFEIVDVLEGKGNWSGYAKGLVIRLPDGTTQQSGMSGNQEYLKRVLKDRKKYIGGEATIQYFTKTPDNKLRFPVSKALFMSARDV
jgi:DNA ligase 1